jgi:hypothetical protein
LTTRILAVPLWTEAPRKTAFVRAETAASADPRLFLDRKGFACHARFADQEVHGLDDKAIGRDQVPRRQLDDIAGHDCADRHGPFDAVAHDATRQCQAAFQLLDCRRRAILLKKAEQGASEHNRQNDGRVHPLLQH